jgi:hypothetical protein
MVARYGVAGPSRARRLANVKLSDCRRALDVVSVRDAVLCFLGYRLGLELLRSVTRRPR